MRANLVTLIHTWLEVIVQSKSLFTPQSPQILLGVSGDKSTDPYERPRKFDSRSSIECLRAPDAFRCLEFYIRGRSSW